MAKIKKVSPDTKAAIRRKSAYTLPNNPTDSGYKADDIRRAFWQPVVDISQSAIAEVERVVEEVNAIFEHTSTNINTISSVAGEYYHSTEGFIYTFSDDEFTVTGYEGESDKIEVPTEVLFEGEKYKVVGIASGAFSNISTVLFTDLFTIESGAFSGETVFAVPKEYLEEYEAALPGFTINPYHTVTSNEERIALLESNKLNKVTGLNELTRVYVISPTGAQLTKEITQSPSEGRLPEYRSNGRLGVGTPTANDDAVPKILLDNELARRGAFIALDRDPSTFIITFQLKNVGGEVLDTKSIDLPLETMIIGARYEDGTIYLTVKGEDEPLAVDISDLIHGLVNEQTFREEVERLDRQDALTNQDVAAIRNELDTAGVYGFGAYYSEEATAARNYIGGGSIDRALKKRPTGLQVALDDNYILSVKLTNQKGETLVEDSVDFPVESLVMNGSYANGILTLTLKNGNTIPIDITSLISGLVADSRKINNKPLSADITLTASDVGAYAKSETDSKVATLKTNLEGQIEEARVAIYSSESEKTSGVIKGSPLDKRLVKIEKKIGI